MPTYTKNRTDPGIRDAASPPGILELLLGYNQDLANEGGKQLAGDVATARLRKGPVRDAARSRIADATRGSGKGTNELATASEQAAKLRMAGKLLGVFGVGLTGYTDYEQEKQNNAGDDHSTGRTAIKAGARTTFATGGALLFGGACSEMGPVAIGCGAVGAWSGDKVGAGIGNVINWAAYDSGISLNPKDWF